MWNAFISVGWIAYLGVAIYIGIGRRANVSILIGLLMLAFAGYLQAAIRVPGIAAPTDNAGEAAFALYTGAITWLVIGLLQMLLQQRPAGRLDPAAVNIATLILPRTVVNSYARAEGLRDAASKLLMAGALASQIKVIERKSNPHEPEIWFAIDYLMGESDPNVSLRASVTVTVERHDFFRFENLFKVEVQVGTEVTVIDRVIAIDVDAASRIHQHITTPGKALKLRQRVRTYWWQIWRPANKITRLRPDWALWAASTAAFAGGLIPTVGPLLLVAGFIAIHYATKRRRTYVLSTGRPYAEPRNLLQVAYWQTMIGGLAPSSPALIAKAKARILAGAPTELVLRTERIAYWSNDGPVQRDQIAVRHRRALGFVHVMPYGDNLYVGWECHLNRAAWVEQAVARGVDRVTGQLVHANRVVTGASNLNEYDLADANFLSEWLHGALKKEIQVRMEEQKIDEEIDFHVNRESQPGFGGAAGTTRSDGKQPARPRFLRTA